jgi:hypothetical protein
MYDVFRYSNRYSNNLRQKRNEVMYDVFRYSLAYEELEYQYSMQHIESINRNDERKAYA